MSRSNAASRYLLNPNGIDTDELQLFELEPFAAADLLQARQLESQFIVSNAISPVIRRLLAAEEITLVDFQRADAYVVLLPELTKLIVPAGVGNLAHNLPTVDMRVLAFTAIVAVREDPHPEDALPEWHHASGIRAGRPSASGFHCAVSGPGPSAVRPEPRANLTRYHGVLACAARLKPPLAKAGYTSQARERHVTTGANGTGRLEAL